MCIICESDNNHDILSGIPEEFQTIVRKSRELQKTITDRRMTQVCAVETDNNQIFASIIDYSADAESEEQNLVDAILADGNKTVIRIVILWHEGSFDLSSYSFRKKLCSINPDNENALILLQGESGYVLKCVRSTLLKKDQVQKK